MIPTSRRPSDSPDESVRIRCIRASNYRSIADGVAVNLEQFTALVGPNGVGKSNVLDVLRFLREALTLGLEPAVAKRLGITRLRRVSATKPRALKIGVDLSSHGWDASYDIQLSAAAGRQYRVEHEHFQVKYGFWEIRDDITLRVERGRVIESPEGSIPRATEDALVLPLLAGHESIAPVIDALTSVHVHSIYPRELSQPQPVGLAPPLNDTGSNWCAVLQSMPSRSMSELVDGLGRVTGDITGVRVDSAGGYYTAEFEHRLGDVKRWFSAGQESDGTLRLAGILTALLQRPAPPLIAIEEPELTINPGLLPLVYDYMRSAASKSQVIITTHSPELVDMLDMGDVRVVQRDASGSTVAPVSPSQREMIKERLLSPGEVLKTGGFVAEGYERNIFDLFASDARTGDA